MLMVNQDELINYRALYRRMEEGMRQAERRLIECRQVMRCSYTSKNLQPNGQVNLEEIWRREQLAQTLLQLEQELHKLQLVRDDLRKKLEKRQKQFRSLLTNAQQLQVMLRREEQSIHHSMRSAAKKQIGLVFPTFGANKKSHPHSSSSSLANAVTTSNNLVHVAQVQLVNQPFNVLRRPAVSTRITLFRPQTGYMVLPWKVCLVMIGYLD